MIPLDYASSKPGASWRRPVILSLIAVGAGAVILFIAAAVLVTRMPPMLGTDTESVTVQQIEQIGAVRLPRSLTNLRARLQSFQDFSLQARFSIPADDLDELIDGLQIPRPLSTTDIPWHLATRGGAGSTWWTPGKPAVFESGSNAPGSQPTTQPAIYRYLLIDKTDPQQYVVWLLMFDT